jgi:hypothetical protein
MPINYFAQGLHWKIGGKQENKPRNEFKIPLGISTMNTKYTYNIVFLESFVVILPYQINEVAKMNKIKNNLQRNYMLEIHFFKHK